MSFYYQRLQVVFRSSLNYVISTGLKKFPNILAELNNAIVWVV